LCSFRSIHVRGHDASEEHKGPAPRAVKRGHIGGKGNDGGFEAVERIETNGGSD